MEPHGDKISTADFVHISVYSKHRQFITLCPDSPQLTVAKRWSGYQNYYFPVCYSGCGQENEIKRNKKSRSKDDRPAGKIGGS